MKIKYFTIVLLVLVQLPLVYGDLYKGLPTKGLSSAGLKQTLVSQLMTGPIGEDFSVDAPPRTDTGMLDPGFERRFHLKIKHQLSSDHLVVIIPGFGQTNHEGPGPYLSELLHRNGYLTLVSNSPAAKEFIIQSSGPGAPGVQRWDAMDLYDMILAAKKKLVSDHGYKINKISIIGTSLGAINSAHLAALDKNRSPENKIGFYRVFSVSPPISNAYGSSTIDAMVKVAQEDNIGFSYETFATALMKAFSQIYLKKKKTTTYETVEESSIAMSKELTFTEEELRFLVGFGFQSIVNSALAAMDTRFAQDTAGVLISNDRTDLRLFTLFLRNISYSRYKSLYPYIQEEMEDTYKLGEPHFIFTETESILHMYQDLQTPNYHLVTWEDDFLLQHTDVEWIKKHFSGGKKGHSKIFKSGGHLGGYYQKPFQQYLLDNLR
jgi:hypothetical protein